MLANIAFIVFFGKDVEHANIAFIVFLVRMLSMLGFCCTSLCLLCVFGREKKILPS